MAETKLKNQSLGLTYSYIAPTLINNWANYGSWGGAGYFKDSNNVVHLRGLIKDGTVPSAAFVLPAGYRPGAQTLFMTMANGAVARVDVETGGNVYMHTGNNAYWSLDGITFLAEN